MTADNTVNNNSEITVSVVVTTWNNEAFIERCIRSILDQKRNFKLEILIGNDNSTDATTRLVDALQRSAPQEIKVFHRAANMGTSRNFIDLVYRCSGAFIAQVDGDDYLIDDHKLQLQLNWMEQHPECTVCFHNYITVDGSGNIIKNATPPFEADTTLKPDFLLRSTLGPGNTTLLRRSALPATAPDWLCDSGNHKDFALQFMVALKGEIGYVNRTMSAYTWHETNITKTEKTETLYRKSISINQGLLQYQKQLKMDRYEDTFRWIINSRRLRLGFFLLENGKPLQALKYCGSAAGDPGHLSLGLIKDTMYEAAPRLFAKLKRIGRLLTLKA